MGGTLITNGSDEISKTNVGNKKLRKIKKERSKQIRDKVVPGRTQRNGWNKGI